MSASRNRSTTSADRVALLSLAALWFLALAAGGSRPTGHASESRIAQLHHAAMMTAMVWMLAVMPALMASPHDSVEHGGHHASGPGSSGIAAAGPEHTGAPPGIAMISLVLGMAFMLSSIGWIADALDTARQHPRTPGKDDPGAAAPASDPALCSALHGSMTIGMAAMLLALTH